LISPFLAFLLLEQVAPELFFDILYLI